MPTDAQTPAPADPPLRQDDPSLLPADAVLQHAGTDCERGLDSAEAARRLEQDGPNALATVAPVPGWRRFLQQFHDPLIDLLSSGQSGNSDRQTEIELFKGKNDAVFDPSSAAATASEVVFESLLAPERLNRLVEQQRRDAGQLGLPETLWLVALAILLGIAGAWIVVSHTLHEIEPE